MNLTKTLQKLTVKEYILLSLPLTISVLVYILFFPYIQQIVYKLAQENLNYSPQRLQIPDVREFLKEEKTDLLISLLDIKPYTVPKTEKKTKNTQQEPPPNYKISFIYIGKHRYVIIDNKLWSEGDTLPYGEKILRITKDGILVTGKWGERWIKFLK